MRFARPDYNFLTFTEIWDNPEDFTNDFLDSPLAGTALGTITQANVTLTFMLLYNKYGNNPIANQDVNQFKFKVFGKIAQYGPAWEQKLKIQEKLRSLGLDSNSEIYKGSRAIYNHAFNPETEPKTGDLDEIDYVNEQNTTGYKKSVLEGLALLADSLRNDVTDEYVNKFRHLFSPFASSQRTSTYISGIYEDEEE